MSQEQPAANAPPTLVLLVENEPQYREELREILTDLGYEVVVATNTNRVLMEDAERLARAHVAAVAVVDMRLGDDRNPRDTQGLELIARLKPCLSIISTAYGTKQTVYEAFHNHGAVNFVGKEDGPEELDRAIRAAAPRFCSCSHSGTLHWHPIASHNPDGAVLTAAPDGARPLSELVTQLDRAATTSLVEQLAAYLASYPQPAPRAVGSLFECYLAGLALTSLEKPVLRLPSGAPPLTLPDPVVWATERRDESVIPEAILGLSHRMLRLSSILVDEHGNGWIANHRSAGLHHRLYDLVCIELDALLLFGPDPADHPQSFYDLLLAVVSPVGVGEQIRVSRRLLDRAPRAHMILRVLRRMSRLSAPSLERERLWGLLLEALRRLNDPACAPPARRRLHLIAGMACARLERIEHVWPPEGWEQPAWIDAHDLHEDVVGALFRLVRAAESAVVVGIARLSRLRLLQQFVLRPDVQERYLGTAAAVTLLVLVDCDRLQTISERALFELMLTALAESSFAHPIATAVWSRIDRLRWETLASENALLAQRNLEHAVALLVRPGTNQDAGGVELSLCFLLHTFDMAYLQIGERPLNSLAALAEQHWGRLSFVLGLRETPARLRPVGASERFERLFAHAPLFIPPNGVAGAGESIAHLERRVGQRLSPAHREFIAQASGGHIGLVRALFHASLYERAVESPLDLSAAAALPEVIRECRALWYEIARDERKTIRLVAREKPPTDERVVNLLLRKGLLVAQEESVPETPHLKEQSLTVFSPLFAEIIRHEPDYDLIRIENDQVWRGDKLIKLTRPQYKLVAFLYEEQGRICQRDELFVELYGAVVSKEKEEAVIDRFQQLIRRTRVALELDGDEGTPMYLLNIPGRGYKLVGTDKYTDLK